MALIYKMRAIAQSNSEYVFWTDSEPDIDGSNAPEAVVLDSITILSVGGTAPDPSFAQHGLEHSPVGLYQFNNNLTDSSGNGYDLTVETGSAQYMTIFGLPFFVADGNRLVRATHTAAFNIVGALTVEYLLILWNPTATAYLPSIGVRDFANSALQPFEFSRYNAKWTITVNDTVASGTKVLTAPFELKHIAHTRSSSGTVKTYENGVLVDTVSAGTGSGTTNARLRIGGSPFVTDADAAYSSVKIMNIELTGAEVLAEYQRTIGTAAPEPVESEEYSVDFATLTPGAISNGSLVAGGKTWTVSNVASAASFAIGANGLEFSANTTSSVFLNNGTRSATRLSIKLDALFPSLTPTKAALLRLSWTNPTNNADENFEMCGIQVDDNSASNAVWAVRGYHATYGFQTVYLGGVSGGGGLVQAGYNTNWSTREATAVEIIGIGETSIENKLVYNALPAADDQVPAAAAFSRLGVGANPSTPIANGWDDLYVHIFFCTFNSSGNFAASIRAFKAELFDIPLIG